MLPVSSADDRTGRRSKVPAPCTLERRLWGRRGGTSPDARRM